MSIVRTAGRGAVRTPGRAAGSGSSAGRGALIAAAAAVALLPLGSAGTASADPAPESHPGNWLYTAVAEGEDAVNDLPGTLLNCPTRVEDDRPTGSEEVCAQLAAVDGDLTRITRADVSCPMNYEPVTAFAYGRWDGRRIAFAKNYPNPCVLAASTGSIFKSARAARD